MKIIFGISLIAGGTFLFVGTLRDFLERDFNDFIQANNIKILFGEITLIICGVVLL